MSWETLLNYTRDLLPWKKGIILVLVLKYLFFLILFGEKAGILVNADLHHFRGHHSYCNRCDGCLYSLKMSEAYTLRDIWHHVWGIQFLINTIWMVPLKWYKEVVIRKGNKGALTFSLWGSRLVELRWIGMVLTEIGWQERRWRAPKRYYS